ncbi:MAG: hypothetical protein K6G66_01770 [Oscillospiraceae bacterium]|nr:hypothetical protein [Oscillospiraceae bacterium]
MTLKRTFSRLLTAVLALLMAFPASAPAALAEVDSLPFVTAEMTRADYWKTDHADEIAADRETIDAVNAAVLACAD